MGGRTTYNFCLISNIIVFFLLYGCTGHYTKSPRLDDTEANKDTQLSKYVLNIEFEDVSSSEQYRSDNFERLCMRMSRIVARHLRGRKVFKDVCFNNKADSDYSIIGKFSGFIQFSSTNHVGQYSSMPPGNYGIEGLLVLPLAEILAAVVVENFIIRSPLFIEIRLSEVAIVEKGGHLLSELDDICHKTERKLHGHVGKHKIYTIVDEEMKIITDKLAEQIEAAISKARL